MTGRPQPEVFTSAAKIRNHVVGVGILLAVLIGLAVVGIALGFVTGRVYGDLARMAVIVIAILVGFAGMILGNRWTALAGNKRLRHDLAEALARRYGRNPDDGRAYFCGWSPGATTAPKDMESDHDVGFLSLEPNRLIYVGDAVYFELYRQQIYSIGIQREGVPILLDMGRRIRVDWIDAYNQLNAFTLQHREGASTSQVNRGTDELAELLQTWHQTGSVPSVPDQPQPFV